MDDQAFGDLTRQVAAAESRRDMLRALGGALAVSAASAVAGERVVSAADVEGEAFGFCRPAGRKCGRDKQCCAGRCKLRRRRFRPGKKKVGRCGCVKKGGACINRVGLACCSHNCRDGKCQ